MSLIILPTDEGDGDWRAEAPLQVEPDGTIAFTLVREWRSEWRRAECLRKLASYAELKAIG